ncbi:MAG: hypothetical protein AAGH88_13875 [Planctomycetota bacterium]
MTVYMLHNLLGQMIKKGLARRKIVVDKRSFISLLEEDGHILMNVESCETQTHSMMEEDGGAKFNADGSERVRTSVVLQGSDPHHHEYWWDQGYRVEQDERGNWTRLVKTEEPADAKRGGQA